jgi:hypothetical protein
MYAGLGWKIVPIAPRRKIPLLQNWPEQASSDVSILEDWFRKWPQAGIGVVCGIRSGIVVLDTDSDEAEQTLTDLAATRGGLPKTLTSKTARGMHRFFELRNGSGIRTRILATGLELRGDASLVILPPSVHPSGIPYEWSNVNDPVPLPEWIRWLAAKPQPRTDHPSGKTVTEGQRNTHLTSLAGSMRRRSMSPEAIEAALLNENRGICVPPLDEEEVRKVAQSVGRYPAPPDPKKSNGSGESQATRLISLVANCELFHSSDDVAFAGVDIGDHRETWPVRSARFRQFLAREFYRSEETAPSTQAMLDALSLIEARARFDGPIESVHVRIAEHQSSIWLDLGDPEWRAVEINKIGWHIVDRPEVRFRRASGMLALPSPVRGGEITELRPFLNIMGNDDWALVLCWLVAVLRPRGPYPILNLSGEQGSAKSTTARILCSLCDPFKAPLRSAPRDERDLHIAANSCHVIAIDNASRLGTWLTDALCRLATGGGLATRKLYTDDEEIIFDAQKPVMVNGIEDIATRGDYIERSIFLTLPTIPEDRRREEALIWARFEEARPRILGALLDGVSCALKSSSSVELKNKPRMADFAVWSVAAEPGLGLEPGAFMSAFDGRDANDAILESSVVATALIAFMRSRPSWKGTAAELLRALNKDAGESKTRLQPWPQSPRALSGELRRLAPNLRTAGLALSSGKREGGTGRRLISIEKLPGASSQPSHARKHESIQ